MMATLALERLGSIASSRSELRRGLKWGSIFVLPAWLKAWYQEFGSRCEVRLPVLREGQTVVGIAPLLFQEETAFFIGSSDVCDYLDFVVVPGREREFFNALLDHVEQRGTRQLDLGPARPDSVAATCLVGMAQERGYRVSCQRDDVSVEMELPGTWDEYLGMLTSKQRHEVRRKLRRLQQAGNAKYRIIDDAESVPAAMDTFMRIFRLSGKDKAAFMSGRMESFFRSVAQALAEDGLVRLGILELDSSPVASVLGFDHGGSVYLYNSGYDPGFSFLSVGVLSKVLYIKDSIERKKKRFDFLKGAEAYKYHLGGKEIPLYRCQIVIR